VAPAECAALHKAWADGDLATFAALRDRLLPLHAALFVETSPGPVKYAVSLLGKCQAHTRLPLVPIKETTCVAVEAAMRKVGVLA